MLAGGLDVARAFDTAARSTLFTDDAGVRTAAWVRGHTGARAIFLVAPDHNEPIPTLAGRPVVGGHGGRLWAYGLAHLAHRTAHAGRVVTGGAGTPPRGPASTAPLAGPGPPRIQPPPP